MLDNFIYENHLGRKFVGLENGVYLNYSELRNYSWSYDVINNKIARLYQGIKGRKIPLIINCTTDEKAVEVKNQLLELAETDIYALKKGKIRIGEYYTNGYITDSVKSNYLISKRLCKLDLVFTSDDPSWYREQTHVFKASNSSIIGVSGGIDYPHDYAYDYALIHLGRRVQCDSIGGGAYRLVIYGACENPTVIIGQNTYTVKGRVEKGETLLIDSLEKTITLTTANGSKVNWFDKRGRDSYIFEAIPAGQSTVTWNGAFGFDLTIIEKRSEPKWT